MNARKEFLKIFRQVKKKEKRLREVFGSGADIDFDVDCDTRMWNTKTHDTLILNLDMATIKIFLGSDSVGSTLR